MLSKGDQRGFLAYVVRSDATKFGEIPFKGEAQPSAEHQVVQIEETDTSPSTTSCFLESEEGRTFTIVVNMMQAAIFRPEDELTITIHVDGRKIAYVSVPRDQARWSVQRFSTMISEERGRMVEGKLIFTKLRSTDDEDEVTISDGDLRSIGQIQVDLHRGWRNGYTDVRTRAVEADMGVASEESKKQVISSLEQDPVVHANTVRLGGVVGSTSKRPYEPPVDAIDWLAYDVEKPFHRFIFNYRTRPALELMDIITGPRYETPPRNARRVRTHPDLYEDYNDEGIDEAGDEIADVKPRGREAVLTARVADLERQVERLLKRPRMLEVEEVIDLTGND